MSQLQNLQDLPAEFVKLQEALKIALAIKTSARVLFVETAWMFALGKLSDPKSGKDTDKMKKIIKDHIAVVQKTDDNDNMELKDFRPVLVEAVRSHL